MKLWLPKFLRWFKTKGAVGVGSSAVLDRQCENRQAILSQVERISECAGIGAANDQLVNGNCVIISVLASGKGNVMRLRYLIGHLRASDQSRNSLGHETCHYLQNHE